MNKQELNSQIDAKLAEINGIFDKAGEEALPKDTHQRIVTLNKEIEDFEYQLKDILDQEGIKAKSADRQKERNTPQRTIPFADSDNVGEFKAQGMKEATARRTIGDAFLNDPAIKAWREQIAPQGRIPDKARIQSPPVQFKNLITGVSDTSGGAFVMTDFKPYVDFPNRELTIRDLITVGQTDSDIVEMPRFVSQTNAAAGVAEATTVSNGAKPESDLVLEKVTASVITIAHWLPATKRALADAGQIRTLINNFLMYGLQEELEDQILNGSGVGENFDGIYNASVQVQAWSSNLMTTTRKARTLIKTVGRARPTGWVMHPNDWEEFDLSQDNEARYFYGGPSVLGTPRLWGLPVVETEAATENLALVGDFKKAALFDREQASISVSDSHSDFFVRNLVAILAEMRAAFIVLQPTAFCTADLTA